MHNQQSQRKRPQPDGRRGRGSGRLNGVDLIDPTPNGAGGADIAGPRVLDVAADPDGVHPPVADGRPRVVHFHGATYRDTAQTFANGGQPPLCSLTVSVRIEDGDVAGLLAAVAANGGVGAAGDDGVYRLVPWPCAAVEIEEAGGGDAFVPPAIDVAPC